MNTESRPILITGATGTLGRAFDRICSLRGLNHVMTSRATMDIGVQASVEATLDELRPWAVINTAGYVRVDQAESEPDVCKRENTIGAVNLAEACAIREIPYITYSTDLVFDGRTTGPYVESDLVAPLNVYGASKAAAERLVLERHPGAMVARTSALFGPWDTYNFAHAVIETVSAGHEFLAASDMTISPTYVPSLVNTSLDLLLDGETGVWHLANNCSVTWEEFARVVAGHAGLAQSGVVGVPGSQLGLVAERPSYCVLASTRGALMPTLETSMEQFLRDREVGEHR